MPLRQEYKGFSPAVCWENVTNLALKRQEIECVVGTTEVVPFQQLLEKGT